MTTSKRNDATRITIDKDTRKALARRLQAERDAHAALVGARMPMYERQATTGRGETDYVNVETEREVVAALDGHARRALDDIVSALTRMRDGTYGHCSRCGVPIDKDRLSALPRARYCIACQRDHELR